MEIRVLKEEKDELEIELDNLTIAELLREYLNNDDSVSFVAWRKEHIGKNPALKIQTKGKTAKKALADAISQIEKDADKLVEGFKKLK